MSWHPFFVRGSIFLDKVLFLMLPHHPEKSHPLANNLSSQYKNTNLNKKFNKINIGRPLVFNNY